MTSTEKPAPNHDATTKPQTESIIFSFLDKIKTLSLILVLIFGCGSISIYCAFIIHFTPGGVTLNDTFPFLLAALPLLFIASTSWAAAYTFLKYLCNQSALAWSLTFLLMLLFVLFKFGGKEIIPSLMNDIGIRQENVVILANEESAKAINSAILDGSSPFEVCNPEKSKVATYPNSTILWHGIGEKSLVEVPALTPNLKKPDEPLRMARIEIKSTDIRIARNDYLEQCLQFNIERFTRGKEEIPENELKNISNAVDLIKSRISSIEIIGHADHRKIKNGNYKLAADRADYIKKYIQEKIPKANITTSTAGIEGPKVDCEKRGKGTDRDECLAPNRRVTVKFFLKSKKNTDDNETQASSIGLIKSSTTSAAVEYKIFFIPENTVICTYKNGVLKQQRPGAEYNFSEFGKVMTCNPSIFGEMLPNSLLLQHGRLG